MIYVVRIILLGFISVGLYGALSVSYDTVSGKLPCPDVASIPACFIVLVAYALMLVAALLPPVKRYKWLFLFGWLAVCLLAVTGSVFEFSNGNTCPKNNDGLPLCYVSLIFSIVVVVLYATYYKLSRTKES
jgi:hypothetical protein